MDYCSFLPDPHRMFLGLYRGVGGSLLDLKDDTEIVLFLFHQSLAPLCSCQGNFSLRC